MKKRYFLYISYKGTAYHGWQIQPNGISIQEVLTNSISTVLRTETEIIGAGRTDTGVHAQLMVAHFDTISEITDLLYFTNKLNSFLPKDIAITNIREANPGAHARFGAISRRYEYHIVTQKDVFRNEYAARFNEKLDFDQMNKAADILKNYIDFTSFSKLHTDVKTNNCKINFAQWSKKNEVWIFTIEADRFLRNMVRAIVGTLLEVGRGKMSIEQFRRTIEAKDRSKAGVSVPAHGLFLVDIAYPEEVFI